MTCLTDEILRAKLDGELGEAERIEADHHLASCEACRRRSEILAMEAAKVNTALASLASGPNEGFTDARVAFARFQAEHEPATARTRPARVWIFSRRWAPAWGAVAAAVVMATLIGFAPARTWSQRILAMLRVQKVAVVPVDTAAFPEPRADSQTAKMVSQLISDNVVVTMSPGKPQPAASAEQASQLAGFTVRTLTDRSDSPHISVMGEQAFQMTINRDRLQAILDEVGRSDLQLPGSIDGATVAVHIPKTVFVRYGDLPARRPEGNPAGASQPAPAAGVANFAMVIEVPSPTVSVPPNLNIAQLAEIALEAAGMSPGEAQSFAQTVDWTSTLVIPVPRDATSYMKEEVDGVEGTLIVHPAEGRRSIPGYTLVWVKNGIIYSLVGSGDGSNAVALADSLS